MAQGRATKTVSGKDARRRERQVGMGRRTREGAKGGREREERRGERGLEKRFLRRILEGTKRKETAHEERGRGGKGGRDWPGTVVVD